MGYAWPGTRSQLYVSMSGNANVLQHGYYSGLKKKIKRNRNRKTHLRPRRHKRRIALPPDSQERDLALPKVLVEAWIEVDVSAVVIEEIELMVLLGRRAQVLEVVEGKGGGIDEGEVRSGNAGCVLVAGGVEGEYVIPEEGAGGRGGVLPERHDGVPEGVAEAFDVGVAVLRHDCVDCGWLFEGEAQGDGSTVVEDVDCVVCPF